MDWSDVKQLWPEVRSIIESGAIVFSAIAVGYAVFKLPKIVSDLQAGGGEINDKLQATLKQLTNVQREIADQRQQPEEQPVRASTASNEGSHDPDKDLDHWECVRNDWSEARDYIDNQLVDSITDGRTARKYETIPRHSYAKVIDALLKDNAITPEKAKVLNEMNTKFLSLRKSKRITPEIVREFREWKNAAIAPPQMPTTVSLQTGQPA